ncbi:MAG: alanine racemase [Gammaproteobacteria bacterium]|jgi:alanine racemase|nr:alanine racemase [Gammaproteobacteria bacterium]
MTRPTRAFIDISALRHNFQQVRKAAPGRKILAVVKADAYGHGAARVAPALDDRADAFAVARIEEAEALRSLGITKPVLLLGGVCGHEELVAAAKYDLDLVVHHESQIVTLERASLHKPVRVWLKVDTGMHRLGFAPGQVAGMWERLENCKTVATTIRLMTHLARADERDDPGTKDQIACFSSIDKASEVQTSLANSAGVLAWPESHGDWVRPGIMLYGISPFSDGSGESEGLRPVMTFTSRLIAVNRLRKGDSIGYGGTWTCPEDMPVGVVAVGYADGYPRHAPSGTPVLVNDARTQLIGRVSMDLLSVDLRSQPTARPGDPVILWGRGLPAEEVAARVGSIAYELVSRIAPRVAMAVIDEDAGQEPVLSPSTGESR